VYLKLLAIFISLALLACSDDKNNPTYPFERTVSDLSVVKRCPNINETCYLMMIWQHPIEKKDLQSYYVWVDTTVVKDSVQTVSQEQLDKANTVIAYKGGDGDSLNLTDLIGEFLERDSLHIAIWAKYSNGDNGVVRHLYVYFGDDTPPSLVFFSDSASADTIYINWVRPTDQRDFYFPGEINGPIAGYNLSIKADDATENIRDRGIVSISLNKTPVSSYKLQRFRKNRRSVELVSENNVDINFLTYAIPDGKGFDNSQANDWSVKIWNLKPEHSYEITMVAWDSAGNSSVSSRKVFTTDMYPPLIASEFWLYKDPGDGLPRLDSNRLILFWPRSVDPLTNPTQIEIDATLRIPPGAQYREVRTYLIERWNNDKWESFPRIYPIYDGYYTRHKLENDSMIYSNSGEFTSDTIPWVLPGDTVILRMRAIDYSGHYSKAWISTIVVSKGELWQNKCPPDFAPVRMDISSAFCMEKLQHISDGKFKNNVLYIEAKRICESLSGTSGFENFSVNLCSVQEWDAACRSRSSNYGVIEEREFSPDKFLYAYCGVGTKDSLSAYDLSKRNKICSSSDGIRDLPGQLQEWVVASDDSGEEVPLLKGSSYVEFQGASRVELAQCRNRATPTRIRPRYTTDSLYLYKNGSRLDTLFARDTLRILDRVLSPNSSLKDTLLVYNLKSKAGDALGEDYVDLKEYNRRGGEKLLEVMWSGLLYEYKEKRRAYIQGTESVPSSSFLEPSVGFRCCAVER
jgi:hypothetical protein